MIIRSKSKLKETIESCKKAGKSVLIKKGVFDIVHPGHVFAINMFKKEADVVIILVQSDEFTKKKKGDRRPINNQSQRVEVVDGIKGVDYVYADKSNSREDYIKFLNYLKPTVLAITSIDPEKTSAYTSEYWKLKEFPDKKKPGYSTTEVIDRVLKNYNR